METKLKEIVSHHLEKVLNYDPFKNFSNVTSNEDFIKLIRKDPAFSPFYLDTEKYTIARFGGNLITSLHRKLGDIYEDLTTEIISKSLGISRASLGYSLNIKINNEIQKRSTDGRILTEEIEDKNLKINFQKLITQGVKGIALEVRSCYQIGDAKRIQADRDMALAIKNVSLEPVMLIYCITSLKSPVIRLRKYWNLKEGICAFDYLRMLTKFDLYKFLEDNRAFIKEKMEKIYNIF